MNTETGLSAIYAKNITPLVAGDEVKWYRNGTWVNTTVKDEKVNTMYPGQVHTDKGIFSDVQLSECGVFVVSFADRPNTGTQPVADDVVVDVCFDYSYQNTPACGVKWSDDRCELGDNETWKPNHAAMLKQYQSEQGANTMNTLTEQGSELATHYSGNNNTFHRKCNSINRKSMVLNDAGRWIYSDCTTNDELDGDEFWRLDADIVHKEKAHHIDLEIGADAMQDTIEPRAFSSEYYQSGGEVVTDLHSSFRPLDFGAIPDDKPVFTQEAADAGELPPVELLVQIRRDYDDDNEFYNGHLVAEKNGIIWFKDDRYGQCLHSLCDITLKPIDNRRDEEKLRDLMLGEFVDDGNINDDRLNVESLLSSDKFTITLNK